MTFSRSCGEVRFTTFFTAFLPQLLPQLWPEERILPHFLLHLHPEQPIFCIFYRRFAVGEFDLHGDGHLVGIVGFRDGGLGVTGFLPAGEEVGESHAGTLADVDEREDVEDLHVAGIAITSCDDLSFRVAQSSGIVICQRVVLLLDDDAATTVIVGMDEGVRQQFTERLVKRRLLFAYAALVQLERNLDVGRDAVVNAKIEVNDITAPVRIVRRDAIRPSRTVP